MNELFTQAADVGALEFTVRMAFLSRILTGSHPRAIRPGCNMVDAPEDVRFLGSRGVAVAWPSPVAGPTAGHPGGLVMGRIYAVWICGSLAVVCVFGRPSRNSGTAQVDSAGSPLRDRYMVCLYDASSVVPWFGQTVCEKVFGNDLKLMFVIAILTVLSILLALLLKTKKCRESLQVDEERARRAREWDLFELSP